MPPRILLDLDPLRESRDFRLLFAGQLVGVFASQLTVVAIPFEVYAMTRSSLQVGAVSLVQLVPLIAGALMGGALGDAFDRRRIMMVTSLMLALTSGGLAVNASNSHPSLAALYLVSAAAAGIGGVISTTANAAVPALVEAGELMAACASMQVVDQLAMVVAPALCGVLIDAIHLQWVFALVAVFYLLASLVVLRITKLPGSGAAGSRGLASVREGLRFLNGRQALQGVYLIDLIAMVFGLPRALFPAVTVSVFHGGAGTLGCLYAAPGAGALVGALTTGWLARIRRRAWAVVAAVCGWGTAITAFGLVDTLWVALVLLAVAGWTDVISAVLRTTILQTSVPEAFRSRISSLQIAVVEGGPRLGDLESGALATLVSTEFSIVFGGLACMVGALLVAGVMPGFRRPVRSPTGADPPGPTGAR